MGILLVAVVLTRKPGAWSAFRNEWDLRRLHPALQRALAEQQTAEPFAAVKTPTEIIAWEETAFDRIPDTAQWLQRRGVALLLVLVPTEESVTSPHGRVSVTAAAKDRLMDKGVACLDLTPVFRRLCSEESSAKLFRDNTHLGLGGFAVVRESLRHFRGTERGADLVLAGDCTVEGVAWSPQETLSGKLASLFGRPGSDDLIYREGGAEHMGANFALHNDAYWRAHPKVAWILHEHYLTKKDPPKPFPPVGKPISSLVREQKVRYAKSLAVSRFDKNLPNTSPYPDALVAHLYEDRESKERFIGIHRLMRGRKLEDGYCMVPGDAVMMHVSDWETAQCSRPELARLQIVDDFADATLPAFWVEEWSKQWSELDSDPSG